MEPDKFISIVDDFVTVKIKNLLQMLTIKTTDGCYFSMNVTQIKAVNWNYKDESSSTGETVIKLFMENGPSVTVEFCDYENHGALEILNPHWKKCLSEANKTKYYEWVHDQPRDED